VGKKIVKERIASKISISEGLKNTKRKCVCQGLLFSYFQALTAPENALKTHAAIGLLSKYF
jgi:hypothetical protein